MARAISVKVATPKVIAALEAKLSDGKVAEKNNVKKREEYALELAKYNKKLLKDYASELVIDSVSQRWSGQIEVTYKKLNQFDLPEQPKLDLERELGSYEVQEIENAIRILKMTDEETVNASTFKSIAQYL